MLKNSTGKTMGLAFDSEKYLRLQTRALKNRTKTPGAQRIYFEFGGKIFDDFHAARVLSGYQPDMKFQIIKKFFRSADIIFVVSAKDILRGRIRGDHRLTYDLESLRLLKKMQILGVNITQVVITRVPPEIPAKIKEFAKKLKRMGREIFYLAEGANHTDPHKKWSAYDKNEFVKTSKKNVIILSPGGGSGKFGVCLNQLYHEMKRGVKPFYVKFETFPVCDLPITHPLNLAYMAASADFYDLVMKDPRNKNASSYNRDVENYELLRTLARQFKKEGALLKNISSATNMGINKVSRGIINGEEAEKESAAEIGRRLIRHKYEVARGEEEEKVIVRVRKIISLL